MRKESLELLKQSIILITEPISFCGASVDALIFNNKIPISDANTLGPCILYALKNTRIIMVLPNFDPLNRFENLKLSDDVDLNLINKKGELITIDNLNDYHDVYTLDDICKILIQSHLDIEANEKVISDFICDLGLDAKQEEENTLAMLPYLKSVFPQKHTMTNNKLSNELVKDLINTGGYDLNVSNRGNVESYVLATFEPDVNMKLTGKPYEHYDRSIMDALVTLWLYGDESHIVTPDMIYRTMTHKSDIDISAVQTSEIINSIEKLRRIHVTVDATEEMQKRNVLDENGNPILSCKFDEFLLSARCIDVSAGGHVVKAYKILSEPILLSYSKMTRQIITINAKYLDIKQVDEQGNLTTKSLKNSTKRIAIRDYLIRRIEMMKHKRKYGNRIITTILFDTIFEETGTQTDVKQYKSNNKKYVLQVLDFFKASNFIYDYKLKKNGKTLVGVDIFFKKM